MKDIREQTEALRWALIWSGVVLGLVLLASPFLARAEPPNCYAGQAPCTRAYSIAITEGAAQPYESVGQCWQWYQPDASGDFYEAVGFCARWTDDLPLLASFSGDTLWLEYITRDLSEAEQRAWNLLLINQPPSIYAVAPSGSAVSRPTYPVVNGSRKSTSNGRVAIGAPCRPSVLKLGNYADVSGQPHFVSGQPLPVNTVAICAKR